MKMSATHLPCSAGPGDLQDWPAAGSREPTPSGFMIERLEGTFPKPGPLLPPSEVATAPLENARDISSEMPLPLPR